MLTIKNPSVDHAVNQLVAITGQSKTQLVAEGLELLLEKYNDSQAQKPLAERLEKIGKRCGALPDFDCRSPDEIIDYNRFGVPE
ncbi:MAG: type II toxin-antitoxin system VapB family antitoxin [Leptolyngbya sp. SIOISBB]|nr:type II toxin-antitoxin system VapB family antitoxin [Leptolyngbya sp. SIOISBB]